MEIKKTIIIILVPLLVVSCMKRTLVRMNGHANKILSNVEIQKKDGSITFVSLCYLDNDSLKLYTPENKEIVIPVSDIEKITAVRHFSSVEKALFMTVALTLSLLFVITFVFSPSIV